MIFKKGLFNAPKLQGFKNLSFSFCGQCTESKGQQDPSDSTPSTRLILQAIEKDTNNNFIAYSECRSLFERALINNQYYLHPNFLNPECQAERIDIFQCTLGQISKYPIFELSSRETVAELYRVMCYNMHLRSVEFLENCLLAVLLIDSRAVSSPIFVEWVKFYVQDAIETFKCEYSIDLKRESVASSLKLMLLRLFQKGFFSHRPPYERNLIVLSHVRVLKALLKNETTKNSLMTRKVNFQVFTQIKEFYEREMKENLHHSKNEEFFFRLNSIVQSLVSWQSGKSVNEPENRYLRELYVKLFLAVQNPPLNGVIFMYEFLQETIQSHRPSPNTSNQDHEGGQFHPWDTEVKEFLSKASQKFRTLEKDALQKLDFQEVLKLVVFQRDLRLDAVSLRALNKNLSGRASPIRVRSYFALFLVAIESAKRTDSVVANKKLFEIFEQQTQLTELSIPELKQLSCAMKGAPKVAKAILNTILRRDIGRISTLQISSLFKIYQFCSEKEGQDLKIFSSTPGQVERLQGCMEQEQVLIRFILRFWADHHRELDFDSDYEQFLKDLFLGQRQFGALDFNDASGNYPLNIFEQIRDHVTGELAWKITDPALKVAIQQKYP